MKRFLKETYILFVVTALSALISFVTGVWIRNILGPTEYGIWTIFSMILTYGYYMNLGILDGFSRDIPRLLGEKKYDQVQKVRNIVFTWMLCTAVLVIVAIVIIILLPLSTFETILSIIAILIVPLQNLTLFHNHLFLTTQQFSTVAMIQLLIGSVQYILMAIFAGFLGVYGLFLGVFTGNIIAIIYSRLRLTYKLHFDWDWTIIKSMLSYGVPITLIGILLSLLTTLDRLIVYAFYGSDSVGHYGLISLVFQGIMVLPAVFHQVMYPKISHNYGEFRDKRKLKSIIFHSSINLAYFSPILLGLLYIMFPTFVGLLMPQYSDGVEAAKIIVVGMFCLLWAALYAQYLTVVNKQWTYLKVLLSAVFMNAILNTIFIKAGFQIEGVALGTAITYFIYPIMMMWSCYRDIGEKVIDFAKDVMLLIAPFMIMIVSLIVINYFEFEVMFKTVAYVGLYMVFLCLSSYRISNLNLFTRKFTGFIKLPINYFKHKR